MIVIVALHVAGPVVVAVHVHVHVNPPVGVIEKAADLSSVMQTLPLAPAAPRG